MSVMFGFLLCGGQCVGADDGCAEQRKSVAQGITRYVVNKVVHHDQTVHTVQTDRPSDLQLPCPLILTTL